jgi:hypothetical protein
MPQSKTDLMQPTSKDSGVVDCPFCYGDFEGCCFCEHSGKIKVGGNDSFFKSLDELKPLQQRVVKESDLRDMYNRGAFDNLKGNNTTSTTTKKD